MHADYLRHLRTQTALDRRTDLEFSWAGLIHEFDREGERLHDLFRLHDLLMSKIDELSEVVLSRVQMWDETEAKLVQLHKVGARPCPHHPACTCPCYTPPTVRYIVKSSVKHSHSHTRILHQLSF